MVKKGNIIKIKFEVKRHWIILSMIVIILIFTYFGEIYADSANCSKANPLIDCGRRGTIDIQQLYTNKSWTETTGLGSHWITNENGQWIAQPEFRDGYYHAVCTGTNSTCFWHIDKYPATQDLPFGFVLHFADFLTLVTPISSEDFWQILLWVVFVILATLFIEAGNRLYQAIK